LLVADKQQPAKPQRAKVKLEIRLLRYAAGAITALAVVGGAGWLLRQRSKRRAQRTAPEPDDQ